MTDSKSKGEKKTLGLSRPGKLELNKTVEAGEIRQSFSHGRSKSVTVEVRKKRTYAQREDGKMREVKELEAAKAKAAAEAAAAETVATEEEKASKLTNAEKAARAKALQDAKKADEERAITEKEEAARRAEEEAEAKIKAEEEAKRKAEEEAEAAKKAKEEAERTAEEEEAQPKAEPKKAKVEPKPKTEPTPADIQAEESKSAAKPKVDAKPKKDVKKADPTPKKLTMKSKGDDRRRGGKMTLSQALDGDGGGRTRSLAAVKRAREKEKLKAKLAMQGDQKKIVREVTIPEVLTVQELANRMAERGGEVVKALMKLGVMATITQSIDADTAELVVEEFGHKVKRVSEADVEIGLAGEQDSEESLQSRPPVVTVMGHVDHGKTSLLDALRSTDVAEGEAGGITQHIGAYQVTIESGDKITFIDTPGHEAFSAMRARGASVTDIVILVVAADDGIMPQTVEAIRHARAANAPIIVAINKMDKPGADPNRVRTELLSHELVVEEMGGDVLAVEVSAKQRTNLDKLEEAILLQAEILDLKANPDRSAEGVVVEARMERGRGNVATVLVQRGSLNVGDIIVAGNEWGRVRALVDDHGRKVDVAGPATPVEVLGLNGSPSAGDEMVVVNSEARAREVSEFRQRKERQARAAASARGTLEQMFERIKDGEQVQELPVVIKADVQGSVEAIEGALEKMATEEVKVRVLHSAVGGINESDVTLAKASEALIIGFNVRANPQARDVAKRDGIEIRYYSIIYNVVDDLKNALSGMLAPTLQENFLGYAEIREVFNVSKVGKVAGCMVTDGMVKRGSKVRLLRDDVVIHEGDLSTLRRFKDEVKEVKDGYECGMSFEKYNDIQVGDVIECFEMEEVARELE